MVWTGLPSAFFLIPLLSWSTAPVLFATRVPVPVPVCTCEERATQLPCSELPGSSSGALITQPKQSSLFPGSIFMYYPDRFALSSVWMFVQVFVVIIFQRNLFTEVNVNVWVNGVVWVLAHSDIPCILFNFQRPYSLVHFSWYVLPRYYVSGLVFGLRTTDRILWYMFTYMLFFFFWQCPFVLFVS